jgi:hypothetical protein
MWRTPRQSLLRQMMNRRIMLGQVHAAASQAPPGKALPAELLVTDSA